MFPWFFRQAQNLRDELYQAKLRLEKETASLKEANKVIAVESCSFGCKETSVTTWKSLLKMQATLSQVFHHCSFSIRLCIQQSFYAVLLLLPQGRLLLSVLKRFYLRKFGLGFQPMTFRFVVSHALSLGYERLEFIRHALALLLYPPGSYGKARNSRK